MYMLYTCEGIECMEGMLSALPSVSGSWGQSIAVLHPDSYPPINLVRMASVEKQRLYI